MRSSFHGIHNSGIWSLGPSFSSSSRSVSTAGVGGTSSVARKRRRSKITRGEEDEEEEKDEVREGVHTPARWGRPSSLRRNGGYIVTGTQSEPQIRYNPPKARFDTNDLLPSVCFSVYSVLSSTMV